MNDYLFAIFAFLSGFAIDVVWALYIKKVAESKRIQASLASVGTGICGVMVIETVVHNVYFAVFYWIGLFCGTYFYLSMEKRFRKPI